MLGGVISGGLTFASMMPMAHRLVDALDGAAFDYTQEEFEQDIIDIENMAEQAEEQTDTRSAKEKLAESGKKTLDNLSVFFAKKKQKTADVPAEDPIEKLKKLAELKEAGIITEAEFESKKAELLAQI